MIKVIETNTHSSECERSCVLMIEITDTKYYIEFYIRFADTDWTSAR